MQKFIVDIAGSLPTIIAEYSDPNSFTNSYIYADAQILVQYAHSGDPNAADDKYYYVHDRLGSVRMVVDCNTVAETVTARNTYTYSPFGNPYAGELSETVYNPFQFTGQWYDVEIDQYYLRARMYDPTMMRFTTRDPVGGKFKEPLTLHKYLYCLNNPTNATDPSGEFLGLIGGMWARAKHGAAAVASKMTAEEVLIEVASTANAMTQGYINMLFGPDDMSDKAKFWVGFTAGFGEMQIGLRTGSAALAATAASTFTSAANSALSSSTDFISWGTAINIGISAAVGGIGDYAMSDDAIQAIHMWAIGVDAAMVAGVGQQAYDDQFGE